MPTAPRMDKSGLHLQSVSEVLSSFLNLVRSSSLPHGRRPEAAMALTTFHHYHHTIYYFRQCRKWVTITMSTSSLPNLNTSCGVRHTRHSRHRQLVLTSKSCGT
ncbi:hypothetical protein J6590_034608 [Homalodisca vitripennis]|nr:hypothetical protein J6590_034608 [Homalodisca vitripennis]